jgi:hypothetical protein
VRRLPFLAPFGHAAVVALYPLLGNNRSRVSGASKQLLIPIKTSDTSDSISYYRGEVSLLRTEVAHRGWQTAEKDTPTRRNYQLR